jgi:surfeit locus 1 family protein
VRRFPVAATLAFAVAFAILCGLGVWQLKRRVWKQHLLAEIAALQHAPSQPLTPVLERARKGQDVDFVRVELDCLRPDPPAARVSLYATGADGVGWRSLAPCRIAGGPWPMVVIDRGLETASARAMQPSPVAYPPPRHVVGVVRAVGGSSPFQRVARASEGEGNGYQLRADAVRALERHAGLKATPVVVVAEREDPAPVGLEPAAVPTDVPNRHFEYALTWFGLALGLLGVYAGMMATRLRRAERSDP